MKKQSSQRVIKMEKLPKIGIKFEQQPSEIIIVKDEKGKVKT